MWRFISRIRGVSLRWPRKIDPDIPRGTEHHDPTARWHPTTLPHDASEDMVSRGDGKPNITVCVEGNIGSGKSTLLEYFARFSEVELVSECMDDWRSVKGENLLDLMYKDPERWSYLFQSYVQMTMAKSHAKPSAMPVKLMERSIYSARFCFVENMYLSGKMSEAEYLVYCEWFKKMTEYFDCGVDLVVYLRTDPGLVHERAKKRARTEEQAIPLQYFEELHERHEEWICEEKFPLPAPVFVIDANDDLPTMYTKYKLHTRHILRNKSVLSSFV
ncbi:deoxynucleoside kinase-like [Homarus americanus]|uniref:deoxynucleoside kinase-like n=1 Tax=Homarus americanus TaxID=6706 RepID=UPI001C456A1C|nr:deoxynucleoside kinase-like [Homarus americanus]